MEYESDKVIGLSWRDAIVFIEENDLWFEVIHMESDSFGKIIKVVH